MSWSPRMKHERLPKTALHDGCRTADRPDRSRALHRESSWQNCAGGRRTAEGVAEDAHGRAMSRPARELTGHHRQLFKRFQPIEDEGRGRRSTAAEQCVSYTRLARPVSWAAQVSGLFSSAVLSQHAPHQKHDDVGAIQAHRKPTTM